MRTLASVVILVAAVASAAPPAVEITSPRAGSPVFGAVQFSVAVKTSEPIAGVRFFIDGRAVGEKAAPPFSIITMLGDENVEHLFRAEAVTASGAVGSVEIRTPALQSNEEVDVELRQLYVRVTKGADPVLNLTKNDFVVSDDAKAQQIETFASGDAPLAAVVMLDASTSMAGVPLKEAISGATAFFRAMGPLDEGQLMVFSDRLLHVSPFTTVSEVLLAGLDGVRASGGTALNDHLYLALRQADQRQGRRVVILLSDGVDSDSALPMSEVRRVARSSQAIIYWIRLQEKGEDSQALPNLYSTWRDKDSHRNEFQQLTETVLESGGRIVPVTAFDRIKPTFVGILAELRGQYVLGYYPADRRHDGSWHAVGVTVKGDPGRGLTVRTRDGYLDY
ncbi:MAG: VWA domain-containing protein [Thermoanaerobaculaceae bacterium]|nr:VWA domain-containing protein [Thermoanaerobaculaceae bacterium]